MYLTDKDFNINKGRLQLENRDNLVLVSVISSYCDACTYTKNTLHNFPDIFPSISFAYINIDKHSQFLNIAESTGLVLRRTPTFLLFKIGVFNRVLNIDEMSSERLKKELYHELSPTNIIPVNSQSLAYSKFYEI